MARIRHDLEALLTHNLYDELKSDQWDSLVGKIYPSDRTSEPTHHDYTVYDDFHIAPHVLYFLVPGYAGIRNRYSFSDIEQPFYDAVCAGNLSNVNIFLSECSTTQMCKRICTRALYLAQDYNQPVIIDRLLALSGDLRIDADN